MNNDNNFLSKVIKETNEKNTSLIKDIFKINSENSCKNIINLNLSINNNIFLNSKISKSSHDKEKVKNKGKNNKIIDISSISVFKPSNKDKSTQRTNKSFNFHNHDKLFLNINNKSINLNKKTNLNVKVDNKSPVIKKPKKSILKNNDNIGKFNSIQNDLGKYFKQRLNRNVVFKSKIDINYISKPKKRKKFFFFCC